MSTTRWLLTGLVLSCAPPQATTETPTAAATRVPYIAPEAYPLGPPPVRPEIRLLQDNTCVTPEPDPQPALCPLWISPHPSTVRERDDGTCVVAPADEECDYVCVSEADPVPCPETLFEEADYLDAVSLRPEGTCWEWYPRPVHPHAPRRVLCPRELLPDADPDLAVQVRPDGTCWQSYATRVKCAEP